jgi:dihydrofolate reductase
MIISLIVAYSKNKAIGNDNKLLWHLSDDLKNFKKVTLNRCIVMGRKTYESIGFALPKRTNIVVTRNKDYEAQGCIIVNSLEQAIDYAKNACETELIICGGAQIYSQSIDLVDKAYITEVDCHIEKADSFFPNIDFLSWTVLDSIYHPKDDKNQYAWKFKVFQKIKD